MEKRWDNAIYFKPNKFKAFWEERLKQERNILIITGLGWDPRMMALPSQLKSFGGSGMRELHVISYKPSSTYKSPYQKFIDKNTQELNSITGSWAAKKQIAINTRKNNNLYIGDEEISQYFIKYDFKKFTDILVDISSLPKSLYFTLLYVLVRKAIKISKEINIYVVACHDVDFDSKITESVDDTRLLKGFKGKVRRVSQQKVPVIWAPILATKNGIGLSKLYDIFTPKDIYPILPFPCKDPRSNDDLLIEYREILVDVWRVDPLNIIYAAEDDPLDVYRSLLNLYNKQKETLKPLGDVSMAVSPLSSKLSSIGAFMAACEENISIGHPIGQHKPPDNIALDFWENTYMNKFKEKLHAVWLTGEPYV